MRAVVPVFAGADGPASWPWSSVGHHHAAHPGRPRRPAARPSGWRPRLILARRAARRLADQPPAAPADPRPGRAARSPGCTSTTTRCCTPCARVCCSSTPRAGCSCVNDEAERLLGLDDTAVGRPVAELGLPESLTRAVLAARPPARRDPPASTTRCWWSTPRPARWQGREVGSVVTLRDHTEIQAVAGRARHRARASPSRCARRTTRPPTGCTRWCRWSRWAAPRRPWTSPPRSSQVAQLLTDRVVGSVVRPGASSALLLGKTAQAAERGVQLRHRRPAPSVTGMPVEQRDAVTILGNLIDNAIDAVSEAADPGGRGRADRLGRRPAELRVADSGPGLTPALAGQVFERGWSTKTADGPVGPGPRAWPWWSRRCASTTGGSTSARPSLGGAEFVIRIGDRR